MEIFFVLFLYLLFLKSIIKDRNQNSRVLLCVLAGFGLWIVLALRSPYCGMDLVLGVEGSSNYYNMFIRANYSSFLEILRGDLTYISSMEVGWLIYCKLVSYVSTNFQVFLAITAFVQIALIGFIIYRYSKDIILSYIVYFCFGLYVMSFSGLRQSTAFALTFFAFHLLVTNRKMIFFLVVLVASSIHSSALFFLIVYPLRNIRMSTTKSVIAILGIFALLPFLSLIVNAIVPLIFVDRYMNYQDEGGAMTLFLLYVLIFIFSLKIKINNSSDNFLRVVILLAVLCQSLGYIGTGAITRIGFYFSIFFSLLFPELVNSYSSANNRTITFLVLSLMFLTFFYLTNKNGYLNVVPYYFFWEKPFLYY